MDYCITLKSISSLEKCFLDESIEVKKEQTSFTVFRGQPLVYQLAVSIKTTSLHADRFPVKVSGDLAPFTTIRTIISVPVHFPTSLAVPDDDYLRTTPGLYPDLIRPLHYENSLPLHPSQLQSLMVRVDFPDDYPAGLHSLTITVGNTDNTIVTRLLDCKLPPQTIIHTEWFYTDCLADYYHVTPFSKRHWQIIRNYLQVASNNGINMILTPIFTPELDTYLGGERTTTQLLEIEKTADNSFKFDFSQLDKWVDLCHECGISYFEMPHFFTQWGAKNAPKIIARVSNRNTKIFGWETDSLGKEYMGFLSQLIPSLVAWLKKKGIAQNTYFHISDEPSIKDLNHYKACKELVTRYLDGLPTIDALSDYSFYENRAIDHPIPHIKDIQPFLNHHVPDLWAYYCGHGKKGITGRCLSLPLARTRILGVQLYAAQIKGFLHWGFNFYNNKNSYNPINPFLYTDGEGFAVSGDMFLVYPGDNGIAWESLRLNALREGMEDSRLLEMCEQNLGRKKTVQILLDVAGKDFSFSTPVEQDFFNSLKSRIIQELDL